MTKDEIGDLIEALPQGLDTDEFIYRLVNWAVDKEREACAKVVEADGLARGNEGLVLIKAAGRIRARGEKPPVKSYAGGKPNYCTPEETPEVTGEATRDVDAVNISADRVDETAKGEHEPVGWLDSEGRFSYFKLLDSDVPLYLAPPKRDSSSWVGLTDEEMLALKQKAVDDGMTRIVSDFEYIRSIEAKLKEKNGG